MSGSCVIRLEAVAKTYRTGPVWARRPVAAVREATFGIGAGETLGLVGETGSGKTTIDRLCLGLIRPDRGRALLDGAPIAETAARSPGRFAAVLQNPGDSLDPRFTVARCVLEPLRIAGSPDAPVGALLAKVGLPPETASRRPHELSGGQRQRVAIARALATRPRFIVFDEAVSALDVSVQAQVLNLIRDLQAELGFAALFITHDLAAARYVSARVAVMLRGAITTIMPAKDLYRPVADPYARALQEASGLI